MLAMNQRRVSIESNYSPNPNNHRTFTVTCHHRRIITTVTPTPSVVRNWIHKDRRRHMLVVGLGVQWRPSYQTSLLNPPATLQLCVGGLCLIFQLLYAPYVPLSLRRFLSDPTVTFVGVSNQNDEPQLRSSKHKLFVSRVFNICDVAAERRSLSKRISMERLAELILGMDGVKKARWVGRSNWDDYWLCEAQVEYACIDTYLAFSMGKALIWNWND